MKRKASDAKLKELYYNARTGYLSQKKFLKRLRDEGYSNKASEVHEWVKAQTPDEISFRPHKRKNYNTVYADGVAEDYQMDIMYFRKHAEGNYQYILLVIDVYSRYLAARPLKTRKAAEYVTAYKDIIENSLDGKWSRWIHGDNEFNTAAFNAILNGVSIYKASQPDQPHKNAIVERVIRTLRTMMGRWRWGSESTQWPRHLQELIDNYNNTWHSTIKCKPIEIWTGLKKNEQEIKWIPVQHKVGDKVRIVLRKADTIGGFKSGERRISQSVYICYKRDGYSWYLQKINKEDESLEEPDLKRSYLDYELIPVRDSKGGPKYEGEEVHANEVNNKVLKGLRKEDIIDFEKHPHGLQVTALGVLLEKPPPPDDGPPPPIAPAPVERAPLWRRGPVTTATPMEVDRANALDEGIPFDPDDYDPERAGWVTVIDGEDERAQERIAEQAALDELREKSTGKRKKSYHSRRKKKRARHD